MSSYAGYPSFFDPILWLMPDPIRRSTRRRTGIKYPHSSTRQRARYARQIAAGQIKFHN